jgi:hypothetical protein
MRKLLIILSLIVLMVAGIIIGRDDMRCGWDIGDGKTMRYIKGIPCLLSQIPASDTRDYRSIQRQVKKCRIVSKPGPMGDYNVCCPGTVALIRVMYDGKKWPFVPFLSTIAPFESGKPWPESVGKDCINFINVIPAQNGDCYRIHSWELSLVDDKHAIEICPPKE